jgi:hypothetical protein
VVNVGAVKVEKGGAGEQSLAQRPVPRTLLRYLASKRCVLFAGAGLSKWGGLPTWAAFLSKLTETLREEKPDARRDEILSRMLDDGKFLEVAEFCKEALGKTIYAETLREAFNWNDITIPKPHEIIVRLPFAAIITTNYDRIIELSYLKATLEDPRVVTYAESEELGTLLFEGRFFILKAHGDIRKASEIVLTTQDYRQIIHANPAFNDVFSAIMMTKSVLFIGYSINDPDFRLLLDRQLTNFSGSVPVRYALLKRTNEIEHEFMMKSANIRVIPYDDHEEIVHFLQKLSDELTAGSDSLLSLE